MQPTASTPPLPWLEPGEPFPAPAQAWGSSSAAALSGVSLTEGGVSGVSSSAGRVSLSGVEDLDGTEGDGIFQLAPSADAPSNAKNAISLTDVLAALKIYLGKSLPSDYSHPANFTAADFNGSGTVDLSDVLQLLKFYLGKTVSTGYGPAWVFIDKDDFTSSSGTVSSIASKDLITGTNQLHNLSKDHTRPADITHDVTDTTLELVGVLRGDVDGSWGSLSGVS